MEEKKEIREQMLALQAAIPSAEKQEQDGFICEKLWQMIQELDVKAIHIFLLMGSEVHISPFIDSLLSRGGHGHGICLVPILRYGILEPKQELVEWVRRLAVAPLSGYDEHSPYINLVHLFCFYSSVYPSVPERRRTAFVLPCFWEK